MGPLRYFEGGNLASKESLFFAKVGIWPVTQNFFHQVLFMSPDFFPVTCVQFQHCLFILFVLPCLSLSFAIVECLCC